MLDALRRDYQWVEVDIMAGGSRTPEFLLLNPFGQVPLVVLEPVGLSGIFGRAWDSIRLWIK